MNNRHLLAAAVLSFAALPAALAVSATFAEWGAGPASLLFTAAERQAWSAVATDGEAAAFARLFWARRDPDPKTPANELFGEFEQRVAFADRQFRSTTGRGAMSARGRSMVLLGPPTNVVRLNPTGAGDPELPVDEEFSPTLDRPATPTRETWIYSKDKKPAFVTKKRLEIRFVPNQEGDVVFADAAEAEALLAQAAAATVTRPNLTPAEASAASVTAWHATPADAAAVAALRARLAASAAAPAGAPAFETHVFQAYDGSWIVPFQLSLPAASTAGQRAVVELSHEDGSALFAYVLADPWQTVGERARLQGNTNLLPGNYRLAVGLLDASGQVGWAAAQPVAIPAGEPAFWLSDLILAEQIEPLGRRQELLEPFSWMSVGVPPRAGGAFAPGSTLWLYAHVCNVSLDPAGKPAVETTLELGGTKRYRGRLDMNPTSVNPRCWALAQSLDLVAGTFKPGPYQLTIAATDRVTGAQLSVRRDFEIGQP